MPFIAVLRILAPFKNARCADATDRVSRRRPSLHETGEPSRSNGSDGRMVRQIFEVTTAISSCCPLLRNSYFSLPLASLGPQSAGLKDRTLEQDVSSSTLSVQS